jgi:signal transduction histidine kinase
MRANIAADETTDPAAATALRGIAETGSVSLDEVGRLVRLMRSDDPLGAPTPGLADIPALVWSFRSEGMDLMADDLQLPRQPLSPALDVTAFRIVAEALTNAARHAAAGPIRMSIREMSPDLEIHVVNPMSDQSAGSPPGSGHGLIGMRERIDLFGGELRAGPVGDGTFEVAARLPLRIAG